MGVSLKRIGILLSTLICTVASFIVSLAMSGICSGRNTGNMKVTSCYIGGTTIENLVNTSYGLVLAGMFLIAPLFLWLAGVILGGMYRKKNHKDVLGKIGITLIWINLIMLATAIIGQITKIIITHNY